MAEGTGGKSTKHIYIRYHFVRDYTEDSIVNIVFIKSVDNMMIHLQRILVL